MQANKSSALKYNYGWTSNGALIPRISTRVEPQDKLSVREVSTRDKMLQ